MAGRPRRRARLAAERAALSVKDSERSSYAFSKRPRLSSSTRSAEPSYSGKCPWGLEIQSLLFPKNEFEPWDAQAWLDDYGKKPLHDETKGFWRARQREPHEFFKGSLRTIRLGQGSSRVKAIVGCPKKPSTKRRR